ncbi:MAG: hypothetical protein ACK54I_17725, partial [Planctomycetota bacterium]
NKVDAITDPAQLDAVLNRYPNGVPISARTREGFDKLHQVVSAALSRSFRDVTIETDISNGKLLAYLNAHGEVLSTQYGEQKMLVHCRLPQKYLGSIGGDGVKVYYGGQAENGVVLNGFGEGFPVPLPPASGLTEPANGIAPSPK